MMTKGEISSRKTEQSIFNYNNMTDLRDNSGNSVEALLVDPNNSAITQYYNPAGIDDPFTYRARQGFIGIEMWPGNDTGVYLQGHLVIPNPWGDVFTNGTTTTTTTDTTEKGGGDTEECCNLKDCCEKIRNSQKTDYENWMGQWDEAGYFNGEERGKNGFDCDEALVDYILAKCDYLYGEDKDTKEHGAWQQRYFACVARWASCKWTQHPETTDEYDPVRVSYARRSKSHFHGWTKNTPEDINKECEKYAGC
jgi:hypothetical protein